MKYPLPHFYRGNANGTAAAKLGVKSIVLDYVSELQ